MKAEIALFGIFSNERMIKKSLFLGFDKKSLLKFMCFMHIEFIGFC